MKFRFYEILHWGPPLEVVWELPLETMRGPPLEGQSAAKCHAWVKVPRSTKEIDEALKPGVYALIDACSADDLQYLHTVFGEGPCRNTLASLQHDYKLNFKYEGKQSKLSVGLVTGKGS
ncbi:hypothetical protein WN944_029334 [Citrus x changshan-huyou]|uniref:Nucleolar 27S pre-rRNA processing Urb2/Npa2 C-terminal domain-containing protein n=1 Tax=Citrus x changshan-huyou TaxID=2935761 RepID=A0AAP0LM45_9ROSI